MVAKEHTQKLMDQAISDRDTYNTGNTMGSMVMDSSGKIDSTKPDKDLCFSVETFAAAGDLMRNSQNHPSDQTD